MFEPLQGQLFHRYPFPCLELLILNFKKRKLMIHLCTYTQFSPQAPTSDFVSDLEDASQFSS